MVEYLRPAIIAITWLLIGYAYGQLSLTYATSPYTNADRAALNQLITKTQGATTPCP